jgi:hypothetical protein
MQAEERKRKVESYGNAYPMLIAALQKFPKEMWQFKPTAEDWSIHELVVHIADSEANSFARCRKFIAEPGSTVMAYNETQWAKSLDYHRRSPDDALELFRWLRLSSHKLIQSLPESLWQNTVYHPENGMMTFDDWLDVYERHIPEHIRQMQRDYEIWLKQR